MSENDTSVSGALRLDLPVARRLALELGFREASSWGAKLAQVKFNQDRMLDALVSNGATISEVELRRVAEDVVLHRKAGRMVEVIGEPSLPTE